MDIKNPAWELLLTILAWTQLLSVAPLALSFGNLLFVFYVCDTIFDETPHFSVFACFLADTSLWRNTGRDSPQQKLGPAQPSHLKQELRAVLRPAL